MDENLKLIIKNSYCPYSKFKVACVVVMKDGQEFVGVNVENASPKSGMCAEMVAIANALTEGYNPGDFKEMHIMGSSKDLCMPCFFCRQYISEFFNEDGLIFCYNNKGKYQGFKVMDICPFPFKLEV